VQGAGVHRRRVQGIGAYICVSPRLRKFLRTTELFLTQGTQSRHRVLKVVLCALCEFSVRFAAVVKILVAALLRNVIRVGKAKFLELTIF